MTKFANIPAAWVGRLAFYMAFISGRTEKMPVTFWLIICHIFSTPVNLYGKNRGSCHHRIIWTNTNW